MTNIQYVVIRIRTTTLSSVLCQFPTELKTLRWDGYQFYHPGMSGLLWYEFLHLISNNFERKHPPAPRWGNSSANFPFEGGWRGEFSYWMPYWGGCRGTWPSIVKGKTIIRIAGIKWALLFWWNDVIEFKLTIWFDYWLDDCFLTELTRFTGFWLFYVLFCWFSPFCDGAGSITTWNH